MLCVHLWSSAKVSQTYIWWHKTLCSGELQKWSTLEDDLVTMLLLMKCMFAWVESSFSTFIFNSVDNTINKYVVQRWACSLCLAEEPCTLNNKIQNASARSCDKSYIALILLLSKVHWKGSFLKVLCKLKLLVIAKKVCIKLQTSCKASLLRGLSDS